MEKQKKMKALKKQCYREILGDKSELIAIHLDSFFRIFIPFFLQTITIL